jgi:hypothetical protein
MWLGSFQAFLVLSFEHDDHVEIFRKCPSCFRCSEEISKLEENTQERNSRIQQPCLVGIWRALDWDLLGIQAVASQSRHLYKQQKFQLLGLDY